MSTAFRHSKVRFHWCDRCGSLLLGEVCDSCASQGREFLVSSPGDLRPCLGKGAEVIRSLFLRHFGTASFLDGRMVFLNKVPGDDRADEVIVGGRVVGVIRYDLEANDFRLEIRLEGALLLAGEATNGVVIVEHSSGHLKGKNLAGETIREIRAPVKEGDPLIVVSGNLICSGVARANDEDMRSADRAIGIRDVGKWRIGLPIREGGISGFTKANASHLAKIESKAVSDIRSYVGSRRLPVTLSFSGGKDSLVAFGLARRALKDFSLIFVNTGLEFPETVEYVNAFAGDQRVPLLVADANDSFWEQVGYFGPPAKDFRWCCKVCKLAPLTSLIERHFPNGTITIEGNRSCESFSRAGIGFVENNPFVPNQIILNPIRDWMAAEVWGYIWWRKLPYNRLYEQDLERIGCYMCPSCLASEWKTTEILHPDLSGRWNEYLDAWSKETGVGKDFISHGFWRWKVLPPKMRKLAERLDLKVPQIRADTISLKIVKGISPCVTGGYSIEGVASIPRRRGFASVAEMLRTVGKVKHSEEYEIALVKSREGTLKVFGGGQVIATAETEGWAEKFFEAGVMAFLRSQLCAACGICAKNCRQGAIEMKGFPSIDAEKCTQCGRCAEACVVAHYYDKLVA